MQGPASGGRTCTLETGSSALASCSYHVLAHRQRRLPHRPVSVRSTTRAFDPEVLPPPPPPPPPPPMPPQVDRRGALLQGAAAAGVGVLLGFFIGSRPQTIPGVDPAEQREIDELRAEAQFRRDYDGHVFVQGRDGGWFEVKLDAQLPGTVLLRRERDGAIYFFGLNIQQVDLTDDYVVIALFGDGAWETTLQRLAAKDDNDVPTDVFLGRDMFRDLVSIMPAPAQAP